MRSVIAGLLATVLLGIGGTAWAQTRASTSPDYVFDIPRLPMIEALQEFITQTGLQVSFWPDAHTDQTELLGPLRGRFTAEAALTNLLASSGLAFQRTNDRSLVVMAPSLFGAPRGGVTPSEQDQDKIAQGHPDLRPQKPPPQRSVTAAEPGSGSADDGAHSGNALDEIIVTGSRIERSGEGPAPVQVFTREIIEQLGAASIPDVLRYTPQQPFNRAEHYYPNGAQYAQMRGIGVDTTLILINGRRVVPTSNSLAANAFDLNSIPLAAVEKIEVLSDSASAIYGADAMGGVVNVVLKKEIPQPIVDVQYGGAAGGADLRRGSLSLGHSTDRFRSSVIFDYYERDFLFGAQRDRWSDQDFRRHGGTDYRSMAGAPGTLRSLTGANLPGLTSPFAMVPYGSTGVGMTPRDFVATAGMRNRTSTLSSLSIIPEARQRSAALSAEFAITSNVTAFTQVLYTNREITFQDELYSVVNAPVPTTNPFNPFEQPVLADLLLTGIEPRRFIHDLDMVRGVGGVRGSLGSSWQWEVAATASTETDDAIGRNKVSAARVSSALAAADPSQALNPFIDGPVGSRQLLASLIEPDEQHHFSRGRQLSAFLRGSLFDLPAGPLEAVFGGEWRDEAIVYDDLTQAISERRDAAAAFAELSVPLLSRTPYSRGDVLSMTLAARLDDYSDFGDTVNPQFGFTWRPLPDLLLRGSYGTSFRPPSLYELHSPRSEIANALRDPARNNAVTNVTFLVGGNPGLRPIEASSMTAGFVLTPHAAPGLRLLSNYWRIHTNHRVTVMHFSSLLANEAAFGDRVVRAEPTPEDIAAGIPGALLQLDISRLNFGDLTTSGVDLEASYEFANPLGRFTQRVSATWINEFTAVDVPTTAPIDRVGVANPFGSIPRWRLVGTLGWKRNGVGLSTTVDWLPGYLDADTGGLTGRRLPDRTLVDVQASFAMDELLGPGAPWDDLKLQTGVKNAFDKEPAFSQVGFAIGFDSSQGDLVGRFGYIKLSKGF